MEVRKKEHRLVPFFGIIMLTTLNLRKMAEIMAGCCKANCKANRSRLSRNHLYESLGTIYFGGLEPVKIVKCGADEAREHIGRPTGQDRKLRRNLKLEA